MRRMTYIYSRNPKTLNRKNIENPMPMSIPRRTLFNIYKDREVLVADMRERKIPRIIIVSGEKEFINHPMALNPMIPINNHQELRGFCFITSHFAIFS